MSDVPQPRVAYAVIATGVVNNAGIPQFLRGSADTICPIPLYIHESKENCEKRKSSLAAKIARVKMYDQPNTETSQPFLGVVKVFLPAKKPMSPERIAKMQAGRKNATPPANNSNPPKIAAGTTKK